MTYFTLMFLGGLFFPNSMLPNFLGHIANALPSTQMSDALRMVAYSGAVLADIWQNLAIMLAWILVCLAISLKFFRWE
jgi:ABC-2 type transport system permease protein